MITITKPHLKFANVAITSKWTATAFKLEPSGVYTRITMYGYSPSNVHQALLEMLDKRFKGVSYSSETTVQVARQNNLFL
jgi:hypothetical protein